jgi:hypothetical protein
MGRLLRAALGLASVAAFAVFVGACESPTLPLPPPAIPNVETDGLPAGQVELSSADGAEPGAAILTINDNPKLPAKEQVFGTEADQNGSWSLTVFAAPGDTIEIYQLISNDVSTPQEVTIPTGP